MAAPAVAWPNLCINSASVRPWRRRGPRRCVGGHGNAGRADPRPPTSEPTLAAVGRRKRRASGVRSGVRGEVVLDNRKEVRWDRSVPDACGGLRRSQDRMGVHPSDARSVSARPVPDVSCAGHAWVSTTLENEAIATHWPQIRASSTVWASLGCTGMQDRMKCRSGVCSQVGTTFVLGSPGWTRTGTTTRRSWAS